MSAVRFIERCIEAGMPVDMALLAARAFEAEIEFGKDILRAKDRARKAAGSGNSAVSVETVETAEIQPPDKIPQTPKTNPEPYPLSPPKGGTSPRPFELAWRAFPEAGRKRSSTKTSQTEWPRASRAAGGEAALLRAVERYAVSPDATDQGGKFVKGFHLWLRDGRWEHWLDAEPGKPPPEPLDPWPRRIREFQRNGYWHADWGAKPKPGDPRWPAPTATELRSPDPPPATTAVLPPKVQAA